MKEINGSPTVFLKIFIIVPLVCYLLGKTNITIKENNSSANHFIGRWTSSYYRKYYYLWDKTFFALFPNQLYLLFMNIETLD